SEGNNAFIFPVPTLLGAQIITNDTSLSMDLPKSFGLVCEFNATASPADFPGELRWGRDSVDDFLAIHSSDPLLGESGTNTNLNIARELPHGNDTPPHETQDGYCDVDGRIYDWDCPGVPTCDTDPISNFPAETLVFLRQNLSSLSPLVTLDVQTTLHGGCVSAVGNAVQSKTALLRSILI
ncbi:MAG: hypothetical protein GX804_02775, partial [Lentisphaerae bacterium]|nr:hypothetical protein [Lentisphaerota bacterium]